MNRFNPQCGYFPSVSRKGSNRRLLSELEQIKMGKWRDCIKDIRSEADETSQNSIKKKLPALMISATTKNGGHRESDLEAHTGLLQCDIDHLDNIEMAVSLRDRLKNDPHAFAAWISPRGQGVKCLLRVPVNLAGHRAAFATAQEWFRNRYGQEIDAKCSDPCRLCFVSHDPDLWINEDALELFVDQSALPPIQEQGPKKTSPAPDCSAPSLPLLTANCTLHNKVFSDFPKLVSFYRNLVESRFHDVQPGNRNHALCEMVPLLFSAIAKDFIPPFAEEFYVQRKTVFRDPLSDHLKQAESLVKGCSRDYAVKQLSDQERVLYAICADEEHRAAFRICHALAQVESEDCPPPEFFLSAEQLAFRLGCLSIQAWRILRVLEHQNVIRRVEKGLRRSLKVVAKASRYRWLPQSAKVRRPEVVSNTFETAG